MSTNQNGRSRPKAARLLVVAVAAASVTATTSIAAFAQAPMPAWAQQCAATTPNPWIKSGYCQEHQTWDKYYCKCEYVPPGPEPIFGFGGGGRRGDNVQPDADLDGDVRPE
jgi:hypothetical protein